MSSLYPPEGNSDWTSAYRPPAPELYPRRPTCCCSPHATAVECIDLRTVGYAPGPNTIAPRELREECCCICHEEEREQAERDAEDEE